MKILPCQQCGDGFARAGQDLYYMARFPGAGRFDYWCTAHGKAGRLRHSLTPQEFHGLPDVTEDILERAGIMERFLKTYTAAGLPPDQARQKVLVRYGIKSAMGHQGGG